MRLQQLQMFNCISYSEFTSTTLAKIYPDYKIIDYDSDGTDVLYIHPGAKVMLTSNLAVNLGLCNGSTGICVAVEYIGSMVPNDRSIHPDLV